MASNGLWIVFLGCPGSGKGTQAEHLIEANGFAVISVGDILRENKSTVVSSHGKTIGELIDSGMLLPDSVIIDLVRSELHKIPNVSNKNVLFDGYPRTVGQAEALLDLALEFDRGLDFVLNFVVDKDIIIKRILGRYKCRNCGKIYNDFFLKPKMEGVCDVCSGTDFDRRADDNEASLTKRLSEYHKKTEPLVDFYSESGILKNIDAGVGFEKVKEAVLKSLNLVEEESK